MYVYSATCGYTHTHSFGDQLYLPRSTNLHVARLRPTVPWVNDTIYAADLPGIKTPEYSTRHEIKHEKISMLTKEHAHEVTSKWERTGDLCMRQDGWQCVSGDVPLSPLTLIWARSSGPRTVLSSQGAISRLSLSIFSAYTRHIQTRIHFVWNFIIKLPQNNASSQFSTIKFINVTYKYMF